MPFPWCCSASNKVVPINPQPKSEAKTLKRVPSVLETTSKAGKQKNVGRRFLAVIEEKKQKEDEESKDIHTARTDNGSAAPTPSPGSPVLSPSV